MLFTEHSDPLVFPPWKGGMCFQLYPNVEYDSSHRSSTKSQRDGVSTLVLLGLTQLSTEVYAMFGEMVG